MITLARRLQSQMQTKAVTTLAKPKNALAYIIAFFSFIVTGILSLCSLAVTVIFPEDTYAEVPTFTWELPVVSGIITVILFAFWIYIDKSKLPEVSLRTLARQLFIAIFVMGLFWLSVATTSPRADQFSSFVISEQLYSRSLDSAARDYIGMYPFQSGYILFLYFMGFLFGPGNWIPIRIFNILCSALIAVTLVKLTDSFFHDKRTNLIVTILCLSFFPLVFFTNFVYGNIPCLTFCLSAVLAQIQITNATSTKAKIYYTGAHALSLFVATAFKPNALIFFVAIEIIWVLSLFISKSKIHILALVLAALAFFSASILPQVLFQHISQEELKNPIPTSAWIAMGLDESPLAPGWYSGLSTGLYNENGKDTEATDTAAKEHIKERLHTFARNPKYAASFFFKKMTTQWNEPTFQTFWTTFATENPQDLNPRNSKLKLSFIRGRAHRATILWTDTLQSLIYISACIYFFRNRKAITVQQAVLALTFLGGFAYSLISEGKTDYVFPYFIILLPYAAQGLRKLPSLRKRRPEDV